MMNVVKRCPGCGATWVTPPGSIIKCRNCGTTCAGTTSVAFTTDAPTVQTADGDETATALQLADAKVTEARDALQALVKANPALVHPQCRTWQCRRCRLRNTIEMLECWEPLSQEAKKS